MHLIVPFAGALSEAGRHALQSLALPNLERLLSRLTPVHSLGSDEYSLSPPHELALAAARGWPLADGALPWAADAASQAGLQVADHAWARLTPVHLHLGTDHVTLTDPAALSLDDADSRLLFEAVRSLFETEGFGLHWVAADTWLATHPLFDGLATASLDRVIGRNVDAWLPDQRSARLLRRLQNEVQMLLYTHPKNDAREAAGLPTVNSFWCSGSGRAAPPTEPATAATVDDRLRAPALGDDWAAWCEAWRALDAGPLARLANHPEAMLTLCGERRATRFEPRPRSLWQRVTASFQRVPATQALEAL
ncbi:hypothetical protein [Ideonella sp. A 288]|uniref:hypothetical protein n=1 Tax=Ideonella sp. A 288 TaxID=1962181 RepID=UPI000B4BE825|nr:hypothetical protein [Ideonella sp. A 288]